LIATLFFFLSRPYTAVGQSMDSVVYEKGTRKYWQQINTLQKEKYNEFREWQKQFLNESDSRFSMMFSVSYGIPVIKQKVESLYPFLGKSIKTVEPDGSITEHGIYTTDGKGFRVMFRGRYMFNPIVGMELGVSAEKYKEIPNGIITTPSFEANLYSRSYSVTLTPQLVMTSPNLRNFYVYGRIGLYMPIWGGSLAEAHVVDYNGTLIREFLDTDIKTLIDFGDLILDYEKILGFIGYKATLDANIKVDFYKNLSVVGFQTAIGFRYQFSKKWGVAMEYFNGGYAPYLKNSKVQNFDVKVELFGRDVLFLNEDGGAISLLPGNEISITPEILYSTLNVNYHKSLDQNSNNSTLNPNGFDPTKPSDELTDKRLAYSHGFSIGLQYNLPSREERSKKNIKKL